MLSYESFKKRVMKEFLDYMPERYADCELAVISGETHHFDRHPEQMQALIRTWMKKIRS